MKKLLFATAIAASAAAFANPINAVGFENYTAGQTFENGGDENNEVGGTDKYFCFDGGSNSSVVTNVSPSTTRTAYFGSLKPTPPANANYLALDTEGGTFWRSINTIINSGETYSLGAEQTVAATGTYLDTLVQFTVTEDEAPTVGEDDKLAIWLQAGEGTTNLMVKAKSWTLEGGAPTGVAASFTVSRDNVAIEPGAWYRLTVKAVQTIIDPATGMIIPAFQIFIDGTEVAATTPQISTEIQDAFTGNNVWIEGMAALASANKLFPTLAQDPAALTDVTLQGVGFQGTGAIDEIVWTEEDPFAGAAIDFTLTWGEGVDAVSYVLSTDLTATNTLTSGTAVQLAPGDGTATIELIPTFTTSYEFDKVTMGETDLGLTFAIPGVTTNAVLLAKAAAAAYPTYVGDNAALKTQYDTWKTTYGADSESAYEKQFLLNVAPATTVADDALKIDSITEVQDGWKIVVSTTVSGAALSKGTETFTTSYNGYLTVLAADTLADLSNNPTAVDYPVTAIAGGKVEITVTAGKFMKVQLTNTPGTKPAQN